MKVYVAIYNTKTGYIKQVIYCPEEDSKLQHGHFLDHDYIVIPDAVSPKDVMVDIVTKKLIPRVQSVEETKAEHEFKARVDTSIKITGGFTSDALGGSHEYPSNPTDQTNMVQVAVAGGGFLMVCKDGVWGLQAHDADQARQVLRDFVDHRDNARVNFHSKK